MSLGRRAWKAVPGAAAAWIASMDQLGRVGGLGLGAGSISAGFEIFGPGAEAFHSRAARGGQSRIRDR